MKRLAALVRAHPLLIGFGVAVASLLLLLAMQLVWLLRLEEASAMAQRAALHSYLEALATEVELFYRSRAERLLNVPEPSFREDAVQHVAEYWRQKSALGARRLFFVDYTRTPTGNFYIYDPRAHELAPTPASDESLAIILAALPWQTNALGSLRTQHGFHVDERNSGHRIVQKPTHDAAGNLLGIAGLILDEEYFYREVLPGIVDRTLPVFFANDGQGALGLSVENERGETKIGKALAKKAALAVSHRFGFVFTDWTMRLASSDSGPTEWAQRAFAFNMTLGFLLALALVAGIGVAVVAANRAVRLSQMKSDFVSNVSHELRTPLSSIRLFGELLRHGRVESPEKIREYGEYIEAEGRRLSRLIENILDFSRIESKRKSYTLVPTDLGEVARSVVAANAPRLSRLGYDVSLDIEREADLCALADKDALTQALHNLLDNAAKYSKPSRIGVKVSRVGENIVVSVRDEGVGIDRADQGKIFERFFRVSTGLVHDVRGSGLGLAIVSHVVSAHHGRVWVESEPGRGSTFFVELPAASGSR